MFCCFAKKLLVILSVYCLTQHGSHYKRCALGSDVSSALYNTSGAVRWEQHNTAAPDNLPSPEFSHTINIPATIFFYIMQKNDLVVSA